MSQLFETLKPHLEKAYAQSTALTLFHFDNSSIAPKEAIEHTSKILGILSGELYKTKINDEIKEILSKLNTDAELSLLTESELAIVKELTKEFKDLELIPSEEYQAYSILLATAGPIWEDAKEKNDFASFAPILEEIIAYNKKFANYTKKEGQSIYNSLLANYEEGFTTEILDDFFCKLRTCLVPFVEKIREKSDFLKNDFLFQEYSIDVQKKLSNFLAEYLGFDFNRGVMAESAHPFSTHLHNHDVRITNRYLPENLESAIFSIIHEAGHGIYEQGIRDEISMTPIGKGTSMGMHESQSRFYENNIGRSIEFWTPLYEKLQGLFPEQLKEISLYDFYHGINHASPSLIRIESDELTYPFHIMIRYEIEKMILDENIPVSTLPSLWNEKYTQYLGITPSNDSEGILQDVHWSSGLFGYFPSYALGSAIASQIYYHLEKIMPLKDYLLQGNLAPIKEYLNTHIHQYGSMKNTEELLFAMTGEKFNPDYYITYLTEKYTKLYQL